jgi:uncharacterized protein (TIGR02231 family)
MKKTLFLLSIILLTANISFASHESSIKEVTVYKQYARITRSATFTITAGNSEEILTNLSTNIIPSSIQAKINGSATLLSLNYQVNYLQNQSSSKRIKELQDSLKLLDNQIIWIQNQKTLYQGEEQLINANSKLGSNEQGITVTELQNLSAFYRERMLEIKKKVFDLSNEEKGLQQKKNQIQSYLNQLNAANSSKPTGEIALSLSANVNSKITVTFSYLISGAGWTPLYDIKYKAIEKPIELIYKANVYQGSGYDWDNVLLTISTGNPNQNNDRPILNPMYVNFSSGQIAYRGQEAKLKNMAYAQSMPQDADEVSVYEEAVFDAAPAYVVNVSENQLTTEYKIENKQSIPSDGKYHLVAVDDVSLDAKYQYHSVPKLDKGAFLLAKVYDFGQYHLSAGMANIFFEDMYIGQTQLNPNVSSDTLLISLGRDNSISVERNQLNDLTSTKFIGSNKKQTYAYEIIVKNNKNKAINIEILDAYPISQNSDIEVELIETDGAEVIKEYGKLKWLVQLNPGQSETIRFNYSIKYPKDQSIQLF